MSALGLRGGCEGCGCEGCVTAVGVMDVCVCCGYEATLMQKTSHKEHKLSNSSYWLCID